MTAIIDYRAGNLTSVRLALSALGEKACVTGDARLIEQADRVVFPGVGAAASAMANINRLGLGEVVRSAAAEKPFLGICLGMQILFEHSEEDGGVDTLGILSGQVRRFPDVPGCKVPQIGWNSVSGLSAGGDSDPEFYFVHSYYAELCPDTVGTTEYAGVRFTAMVQRGRLWACQFHPEKSGRLGLELIERWLRC